MPRIDNETVQRILDAADIVEVVSDFVRLRRSGANYKGLCPFHNDRTPSFHVSKAKNFCKCFSCGKGGSPVGFIMEHEHMTYVEALRYLARKYNIEIVEKELSPEELRARTERESMLAANEFALDHFEKNLHNTDEGRDIALAYFRSRGLNDEMISRFHLGYAINKDTELLDAAVSAGYKTEYLLSTGLIGEKNRSGSVQYYDRFRGRVIFPVHTISGRVVAFGARTMSTDKTIAKYVNSPESRIYNKSRELYGLYQAKNAIARRDKAILVEGYLDVISLHQAGVECVVASSGTSLTEGQIELLKRYTRNVTLIYDGDAAGVKASLRGIKMLLGAGMSVKLLRLPPEHDPDSFARTHSSAEVEKYLTENETDFVDYMVDVLLKSIPESDPGARAKAKNEIIATVACVDDTVERQEYIARCAEVLALPENVVINQLNVFVAQRLEEESKERRRQQARESAADLLEPREQPRTEATTQENGAATVADATEAAAVTDYARSSLYPYEEMILRYVVRYGLRYIVDFENPDGTVTPGTVFDLIDNELNFDGLVLSYEPFARTMEAVRELRDKRWQSERAGKQSAVEAECATRLEAEREKIRTKAKDMRDIQEMEKKALAQTEEFRCRELDEFDTNFCQRHLTSSPDDEVRRVSNDLLVDKYVLSRLFVKEETPEGEREQLRNQVLRAVYELRNAIVTDRISELNRLIREAPADRFDMVTEYMNELSACKAYQTDLVKMLGDRIILPRK